MKLSWLTDIHLDCTTRVAINGLLLSVKQDNSDAVLITGDIETSHNLSYWLKHIQKELSKPIYYVLGNHDFYGSTVNQVRHMMGIIEFENSNIIYLSNKSAPIELSPTTCLIGHDGWGDGRNGKGRGSNIILNDSKEIKDIAVLSPHEQWDKLQELGQQAATHLRAMLKLAIPKYKHIILATHVPPFEESCWYDGHVSDDNWLSHMTCKAVGDVIIEMMQLAPDCQLTVYCGHSHHMAEYTPLRNVVVYTGGARYYFPEKQKTIEVK